MLLGIRWGSLRAKIIAWSFVPTAIILGAVALVTYSAYQQVTEQLVIERNRELTRLSAGQLTTALKGYIDLLDSETRRSDLYRDNPSIQREALLQARNRLAIFDGGVLLLDTFGTVVATEPERPEMRGQDWSDHPYYRQVLESAILGLPSVALSDIVADAPGGADALAVAVPVTSPQGEFTGILVGLFRVGATSINTLYGDIVKLRLGESNSAYIVDGSGRLIFHSDPARIGDDISEQEVVQLVLSGQTDALRARDFEDRDIVAAFAPVPGTSWGLVTEENWRELLRGSQSYQGSLLLLLALGLIVPAIVVAIGVRRITRPLADLTHAAREVASGKFGQTISAETGDEIEDLAGQFSLMSAQLQESYANLEQRVAIRTRELAALNAIATVVSQSLDLDEILNGALGMTVQVMGVDAGGIYLLDERAGILSVVAQQGFSPDFVAEVDRLRVGEGFSGRVVESGQPLVVKDASADPRLTRLVVQREQLRSLVIVPLCSKGRVLGTLFLITHSYRDFAEQDVQLLTSIGHQIGVAVDSARLFQAEQRRAEQFRVITEVGRRITSILDIDELLVQVVHLIRQSFGYDHVGIALIEGEDAVYKVGTGVLWDDGDYQIHPQRLKVGEEGITGWVAAHGEPLLVPDVDQEPRYVPMRGSNTRSELTVPIAARGQVIGVLDVQSDRLNAFDGSDLTVLQSLASQTAIAVENAQLFDAEQRRAEQFRVISEVGHRITSILAVDELLGHMAELIREAFSYYGVAIGLVEGDYVVFEAGAGAFRDVIQAHEPLRLKVEEEGLSGWVAATGEPLVVPDVSQEPRYYYVPEVGDTRSEICVPLRAKGIITGVLIAQSERLNAFDESDLVILQALANQAAISIENARLFDAEQRRAEQFRVISEVGRKITSILSVDEMLLEMATLVQEAFGYYHVGIGLVEQDEVVSMAEVGAAANAYRGQRLKVGKDGVWGWVAMSGQPLLVPDVSKEPRFQIDPRATEIRSAVCVPLKTKEAVVGLLGAESDQPDAFDESDLVVLQSLAQQAAFAIENARFFRDITRQVRELRALADASRAISSVLDRDQLLQALYEQIRLIAPTDFYLIALYDEATNMVSVEINVDEGVHYPREQYILDKGLLTLILHDRETLRFTSLTEEKHELDVEIVPAGSPKVNHGWLGVPMLYGDKVVGAIVVGSYQRGVFDQGHEQTLTSIANQAAVALENARLYSRAQQLAVMEERQRLARELHDAVTQTLFSASLIAEALPELWESAPDDGRQLLRELRQLSRGALAEMRTLLLELRPAALVEASLEDLLRQLGEAATGRTGTPVQVAVESPYPLPPDVHVTFYRIAQEALNNVVKHAKACQVEVRLSQSPSLSTTGEPQVQVELQVKDDGCGFDPSAIPSDRLGLGILHERAEAIGAKLRVESQRGQGTQIAVLWQGPLAPREV